MGNNNDRNRPSSHGDGPRFSREQYIMQRSRIRMKMVFKRQELAGSSKCRNVTEQDVNPLGTLMLESYRGTIDYEGEHLEDAVDEVHGTINGKYGKFCRDCSFIIEQDGVVKSASMATNFEDIQNPLLAFILNCI